MTNSRSSPRFSFLEVSAVTVFLALLSAAAGWYFFTRGYLLYYGDAQAHLNISRSLFDSRTPGYDQLGTVWLPVLHIICLPFVQSDSLWSSGLAGTIPVGICFVLGGLCLYSAAKLAYNSAFSAGVVLLAFVLNPNVLYLSAITMTEIVFVLGLTACLLAILQFRRTQNAAYIFLAVFASWWMSLTRYDGWFLIPFIAVFLAAVGREHKFLVLIATGALASLAPVYWVAHNWYETGNALDFYNGPYSAAAIQAHKPYPGFHDWPAAIHYYFEAGRACCGNGLLVLGIIGLIVAVFNRQWLGVLFLSLTPIFYVWSVHSSSTPIYLPWLWPFGYYNSRYGLAVVVLMSFASGAFVDKIPARLNRWAVMIPLLAMLPWILKPNPDGWICWKESERNSVSRRGWTTQAASYFGKRYHTGEGVLTEFGDMTGVFGKAAIPLKETLHEGNGPTWFANTMPSGLVRQAKWAMTQEGDKLSKRVAAAGSYDVVEKIQVEGAPALLIYRRRELEVAK